MNNVTPMYANNTALTAIRDGGYGSADFDIAVAPLTYNMPYPNDNIDYPSSKSVIYRTDTGAELGIHGHKYAPVAPKHLIDATRNIIERSDLSINNMQETIRTSHNGARVFVKYTLPEHTYTTSDGDSASLSLLSISSTDGTWPLMISAAAIQMACTNLQVFVGGEVAVYKAKHTQSLDIERGSRIITKSLGVFHNERDLWQKWHGTDCNMETAFRFFADALKCGTATSGLLDGTNNQVHIESSIAEMPRRNLQLEYIWNIYKNVYSKRLGHNYWAVYNALTDWSTHASASRDTSQANIASIQNDRQQTVRQAVQSNYFMKAA